MKPRAKKHDSSTSDLNSSLLVGFDFTRGEDVGIVLVGKVKDGKTEIINAFQGEEAWALYQKLITKTEIMEEKKDVQKKEETAGIS